MYVHVDVLLFSAGKIILNSYAILTGFITKLLALVLFQEILRLDNIFHWFIDNWSKKCPRRSPSQKSDKIPEKTGKRKWFSDVEKISSTCRICSRSSKTSFGCPFAPNECRDPLQKKYWPQKVSFRSENNYQLTWFQIPDSRDGYSRKGQTSGQLESSSAHQVHLVDDSKRRWMDIYCYFQTTSRSSCADPTPAYTYICVPVYT